MNDETRVVIDDAETPVNPYSLLAAVNASSGTANTAWLIFLGLMAYLLVTVAGVSHRDLLLNSGITLPILQTKIDLTRFFLFAPIVWLLVHVGLLGQLALLARKTLEFNTSLRMLESTDQRTHPLRLELGNFFFVQALAGPERSRVISSFLHSVSWLTLVIFPVLLLLYVQVAFLPFHDPVTTFVHRLVLLADVAAVAFFGVFLMHLETSFFRAFWRAGVSNPGSMFFGTIVLAAAAFFGSFVATIPDVRDGRPGLFAAADGSLFGLFPRNLNVVDADLVADKDVTAGERSLSLRGRDLRHARLDRTDLHQADLTGANLDGASLAGADLRHVWLQCGDLDNLLLTENRPNAACASARGANFAKARLTEARMAGLNLSGAHLEDAMLEGADLSNANMSGADFSRARMPRSDLSGGALLQGANFLLANLQGADLAGAKLQMADFSSASMQGANLSLANLEGAVLREANLEGASLQMAKLFGADMRGARLQLADMSGVKVWRTTPPGSEGTTHADITNMVMSPPSEEDIGVMKSVVAGLETGPLKVRLSGLMAPLGDAGTDGTWAASPEGQIWTGLAKASEATMADGYRARITEQLARLACRARFGNGAVAVGVVRRSVSVGFKGDAGALYDRLKSADCPAAASLPAPVLRDLATAADAARGQ